MLFTLHLQFYLFILKYQILQPMQSVSQIFGGDGSNKTHYMETLHCVVVLPTRLVELQPFSKKEGSTRFNYLHLHIPVIDS